MIRTAINNVLEKVLIAVISIMLIAVVWQVISRYVLGAPSTLTDEVASFSLIWLGLLGAAYATGKELHLAIDLIPKKIIAKSPTLFMGVVTFSIAVFAFLVMVIGGVRLCWLTYTLNQNSAALEIPLAFVYAVLPLSGLLIVYFSLDIYVKQRKAFK
ncbi:TRAP transporter small permease [Aquimarina sp. U1-2]|uniref:TRAP transporter small permease n=1 Tax=Aquimarina sp. U1-2 TaxID=2823141 RepID=UPI001FF04980|nr:TRAP transporter small permease [Aquimarina sp. U1-2]